MMEDLTNEDSELPPQPPVPPQLTAEAFKEVAMRWLRNLLRVFKNRPNEFVNELLIAFSKVDIVDPNNFDTAQPGAETAEQALILLLKNPKTFAIGVDCLKALGKDKELLIRRVLENVPQETLPQNGSGRQQLNQILDELNQQIETIPHPRRRSTLKDFYADLPSKSNSVTSSEINLSNDEEARLGQIGSALDAFWQATNINDRFHAAAALYLACENLSRGDINSAVKDKIITLKERMAIYLALILRIKRNEINGDLLQARVAHYDKGGIPFYNYSAIMQEWRELLYQLSISKRLKNNSIRNLERNEALPDWMSLVTKIMSENYSRENFVAAIRKKQEAEELPLNDQSLSSIISANGPGATLSNISKSESRQIIFRQIDGQIQTGHLLLLEQNRFVNEFLSIFLPQFLIKYVFNPNRTHLSLDNRDVVIDPASWGQLIYFFNKFSKEKEELDPRIAGKIQKIPNIIQFFINLNNNQNIDLASQREILSQELSLFMFYLAQSDNKLQKMLVDDNYFLEQFLPGFLWVFSKKISGKTRINLFELGIDQRVIFTVGQRCEDLNIDLLNFSVLLNRLLSEDQIDLSNKDINAISQELWPYSQNRSIPKIDAIKYFNPAELDLAPEDATQYQVFIDPETKKLMRCVRSDRAVDLKMVDTERYHSHGKDGWANLVIDAFGRMFIFTHDQNAQLQEILHSSCIAGAPLMFAGEILIKKGVIYGMTDQSGHYLPGPESLTRALQYFEGQGVSLENCDTFSMVLAEKEKRERRGMLATGLEVRIRRKARDIKDLELPLQISKALRNFTKYLKVISLLIPAKNQSRGNFEVLLQRLNELKKKQKEDPELKNSNKFKNEIIHIIENTVDMEIFQQLFQYGTTNQIKNASEEALKIYSPAEILFYKVLCFSDQKLKQPGGDFLPHEYVLIQIIEEIFLVTGRSLNIAGPLNDFVAENFRQCLFAGVSAFLCHCSEKTKIIYDYDKSYLKSLLVVLIEAERLSYEQLLQRVSDVFGGDFDRSELNKKDSLLTFINWELENFNPKARRVSNPKKETSLLASPRQVRHANKLQHLFNEITEEQINRVRTDSDKEFLIPMTDFFSHRSRTDSQQSNLSNRPSPATTNASMMSPSQRKNSNSSEHSGGKIPPQLLQSSNMSPLPIPRKSSNPNENQRSRDNTPQQLQPLQQQQQLPTSASQVPLPPQQPSQTHATIPHPLQQSEEENPYSP